MRVLFNSKTISPIGHEFFKGWRVEWSVDLTVLQLAAAMMVVFIGAIVQGSIGFGMAIVAAPFLYCIEPMLVPGPMIFAAMLLGGMSAIRYAKSIDLKLLGLPLVGRLPGAVVGALLLTTLGAKEVSMLLGVTVLLAVVLSVISIRVKVAPLSLLVAGFFSGLMGTAAGIGGPPMALLLQHESGDRIRANLSLFFLFGSLISLAVLWYNGLFGAQQLQYGLMLFPAVLLGFRLSTYLVHKVNKQRIRKMLLLLCSVSGGVAIVGAL